MTDDVSEVDVKRHRQPAYDAVYALIGRVPPRSTDSYGWAAENARVWRAVEAALDAMEAVGRHLPGSTYTVEQFGTRVLRDGVVVQEPEVPSSRERAQARVDFHARKRAEVPGWRGEAVLVRRQQHTTPWEPVDRSSVNPTDAEDVQIAEQMLPAGVEVMPPYEEPVLPETAYGAIDLLEAFGDARIRFWVCPIAGHSDRNGPDGRPVVTVEWRGDIAYCTAPGCGRNSQQNTAEEKP